LTDRKSSTKTLSSLNNISASIFRVLVLLAL
jgi:hypothetical protein